MNGSKHHKANKQEFLHPTEQDGARAGKRMIHQVYLCLGSNIQPEENLRQAVEMLAKAGQLQALSRCYETQAVGSDGATISDQPNYLNMAVSLATPLDAAALKIQVIASIERALGRIRSADKFAPRPIDLDIIVFDGVILDENVWQRVYIAAPFSELLPDLVNPQTGETLKQVSERLQLKESAIPRPEIHPGAD